METDADHALAKEILSIAMKDNSITIQMARDELDLAGEIWALPGKREVNLSCLDGFYRKVLNSRQPKDVES